MKKFKKILLSVAASAAIIAPVAAAVSCNGSSSSNKVWTGNNDGKYSILTGFSATGAQHKALEAVLNEWNTMSGNENKQFSITDVEGGYAAIPGQLSTEFEANDTVKMPNLILDYPDSVGVIAKYDAELNLDDEANTIKSLFDEQFTSINNQIGGIKKEGFYAVPIAKSVDMAAYNAPVMKRIIQVARDNNLFEDASKTPEVEKILAKAGTTDDQSVKDIWALKANVAPSSISPKFGDSILTDSSKMLDFVTEVMKYFDKTKNPNIAVFGIDSATNFMYSSIIQKADGDFNKFLFSKGPDGYIQYNWKNKNSEAYKNFKTVYEKLQKAINAGAVYINKGGAYSSSLETQHQIAFAYGSTAGYFYDYVAAPVTATGTDGKDVVLASYTDKLTLTNANDTTKAGQIGTFSTYNNHISLSTDTKYVIPANDATDHNIQLKDVTTDTAVKSFITAHQGKTLFVSSADNVSKIKADDKIQLTVDSSRKSNKSLSDHPKYLVAAIEKGSEKTLQVNELLVRPVPNQFDGSGKAVLVQGPSLIGIHNDGEDQVVKDFVKWFLTGTVKDSAKKDVTPAEMFSKAAGYVLPTKTYLAGVKATKENDKVTVDSLKSIGVDVKAFDNPADDTTGNFRNVLQSTIAAQYTNVVNNGKAISAEDLYQSVINSL